MRAASIAAPMALLVLLAPASAQVRPGGLVIRDVTVVSPERQTPLEHAYVRIEAGRIADVSQQPLRGDREIDGAGRFLMPGLIDSHVHLGQAPGMTFAQEAALPALAAAGKAQEPRSYLYFGFTTVINLYDRMDLVAAWNRLPVRPDAFFCGGAPIANGFPMNIVPPAFRFSASRYFLYDPRQAERIPASVVPSEHTPAAVVTRMASDGATCVKTHYEPGGPGSGALPTPTPDMYEGLVAAAHARNLPVVMHANIKAGQRVAVDAGVDVITHTIADGEGPDDRLTPDVDELLKQVAARGIAYQPTLQTLYAQLALVDDAYVKDARLGDVVPSALLAWFSTEEGRRFRDATLAGGGGEAAFRSRLAARRRSYALVLERLLALKVRLLFGTDTPATASYGNVPGLNGRLEMERWIEMGVSPGRLFRALTIDNAEAFRLDRRFGTIEVGKQANLLLLRANPLVSAAAYEAIDRVILAGEPIVRETLSARSQP